MTTFRHLFTCIAFAFAATPASADFAILSNPAQFSANSILITFDEGDFDGHFLQPFEVVTNYRGVGFHSIGAPLNMPQAAFDPSPPREFGPGGSAGATIVQDLEGQGLEITLPGLVDQFGAEFEAVTPGDFTFTLFNGNQQVDFVSVPARAIGQIYIFHAFEDTSFFDRVIVRGPGVFDGRVVMDNLRFGVAFAGSPGNADCRGKSVSALAKEFGGMASATSMLGYPNVAALQGAIEAFCKQ